ncbi:MAG: hypothetical protein RIQ54_205 [Candidatus Parcubacteria bacterium]
MKLHPKIALWAAFLLPVCIVLLAIISVFVPQSVVRPQHDFLYALSSNSYPISVSYRVEQGVLVRDQYQLPESADTTLKESNAEPRLYIYRVASGESIPVAYEDVQKNGFFLNPGISPDGYEVAYNRGPDNFFGLFFGGYDYDSRALFIQSRFFSKKIVLTRTTGSYGYEYPQFLGWLQ